ncbi:MAG: polymerase [Verrucomicrobiota bacterium]|jgi:DNA polymerase-1
MATADKKLFLLDGMALAYRAHFAFGKNPIINSKGFNTSALFGFTQVILDLQKNHAPTHLAVAWDTSAPTARHVEFPDYKANRAEMPDDLSVALPQLRRLLDALRVAQLASDGHEADDIIGTLVKRAELENFQSYMVTFDKDFGQLVSDKTYLFKPPRGGDAGEILGVPEILKRWNITSPAQVMDVLALMGDAVDNIPGVPSIGEKTAMKLIGQFGSVENLLARTGELTGKLKENLEQHRADAELSKRLATINCAVPLDLALEDLRAQPFDEPALKALFHEFEFTSHGRRLFGADWKVERAAAPAPAPVKPAAELDLFGQ